MQIKKSYYRSGIYIIEHIPSKRVYVGQSACIAKRWSVHKATLNLNKHHCKYLQRAWNKHGESEFNFRILQFCSLDDLNKTEIKYCLKFKGLLFNIHPPGKCLRGFKHSNAVRIKMKIAARIASNTPEQKQMRSERASKQHVEGILGPRKLVNPVRVCVKCGITFNRYKLTRGYHSGKSCLNCMALTYSSQGGRLNLDQFKVSQDEWDMAAYLATPLRRL